MPSPPPKSLKHYIWPYWPSQIAAHAFALLLSIASISLVALSGPTLQLLTSDNGPTAIPLSELVGEFWAPYYERWLGFNAVPAKALLESLPFLLFIVALVRFALAAAQWFCWERIGEKVSYELRKDLADAYLNLNPSMRRTQKFQAIEQSMASNFSNDIRLVREYIVHFFGGLPREGLQSIMLIGVLLSINPRLFFIFSLGFAPVIAILSEWGKKLRRRARAALKDFSSASEWIQQRFLGIETIKHYRSEDHEVHSLKKLMGELTRRLLRAARVKARTSPTIEAFSVIAVGGIIYIALRDIHSDRISGASQITFFATLGVLGQNLSKLGKYLNSNREGRAGCDRIFHSLNELREQELRKVRSGFDVVASGNNFIELQDISARYPEGTNHALRNFSHRFEGGNIYCLCGPSGAGKSTLFQVLLGTLEPESGRLRIGLGPGSDQQHLISYLPQSAPLFPGTIAENVCWPDANYEQARVTTCLESVGLSELVMGMEKGLQTEVGEAGRALSGGQAQRLQLARIAYRNASVCLIDEGTSALDPELEQLVFTMIRKMAARGACVILIAHRLAATEIANQILVLKDGALAASGPAEKLRQGILEFYS